MSVPPVRIAVISGRMYDPLYDRIAQFERATSIPVTIDFRGTHPELNALLAGLAKATNPQLQFDLVSTHTKYAPSHSNLLSPIANLRDSDFRSAPLKLATIDGDLYAIPRNIDVRLLHYRTDLIGGPPLTWEELVRLARALSNPPESYGFVFTGMGSGLFGTFLELTEIAGARVFTESLAPELNNAGGRWALELLRELYASGAVPPQVANWEYEDVHRCFREGWAAMVCDWPGYYASYRDRSPVSGRFRVARLPAGPTGRHLAYAGCHTFALTRTGALNTHASELLRFLTAPEQQLVEAQQGAVPVRRSVMAQQRLVSSDKDIERWDLLERVIESDLIIPPQLACYPSIEDVLWRTVRAAMLGQTAIPTALEAIEASIVREIGKGRTG